jgi:hypothetical protein
MSPRDMDKVRARDRERYQKRKEYLKFHFNEFKKRNPGYFEKYIDYTKAWSRIKKWKIKNPEKSKAHSKVSYALKTNKIKKEICFCGNVKSEAHHEDYSKPLEVTWLCRKHHIEADSKRKQRESAKGFKSK